MSVPPSPLVRAAFGAVCLFVAVGAAAAEPPPPTDAELVRFVAVEDGLAAGDPAATCAAIDAAKGEEAESSSDPAVIGRRLEQSPLVGPVLRRQGMSGQRFAEISVHVASAAIGLSMADQLDATARRQGKPATNRETLLARSPAARAYAAREKEVLASLEKLKALCGGDDGEDESAEE